jgi:hypothetical protein
MPVNPNDQLKQQNLLRMAVNANNDPANAQAANSYFQQQQMPTSMPGPIQPPQGQGMQQPQQMAQQDPNDLARQLALQQMIKNSGQGQ